MRLAAQRAYINFVGVILMLDWKKTIQDINARLKELSTRTPDILRGEALLAGAGAKTKRTCSMRWTS